LEYREDDNKTDIKEIGTEIRDWIYSAQDRDYQKACKRRIEPPDLICHGVI